MGYLKLRHNSRLEFNPFYSNIDHSNFWECDWKDFYEGEVDVFPPNAQWLIRKEVDLWIFVDSDYAGNNGTRRYKFVFKIYMNMSLINWYSKKQSTIETSGFDAEFFAMIVGVETLYGI